MNTHPTIQRLEQAISDATANELGETKEGGNLISAAGEALGFLKATGAIPMDQLLYDFARLAALAGNTPSDFEAKSNKANYNPIPTNPIPTNPIPTNPIPTNPIPTNTSH
jgi:hypothetical protein